MPKSRLRNAIDSLREALQILSIRKTIDKIDKRSSGRGKRIVKELGKTFTDQEIAGSLEISRQKYTALKTQVKKGKVSSAVLNDMLEQAGENLKRTTSRPKDETGFYLSDKPVNGKRKFKIDFTEMGDDYIKKNMKWAVSVKPGGFASKQSALNWYGGVTGGKEYFSIVKGKGGRYYIYDTRTQQEKTRKGSVSGNTRASRMMERDGIESEE